MDWRRSRRRQDGASAPLLRAPGTARADPVGRVRAVAHAPSARPVRGRRRGDWRRARGAGRGEPRGRTRWQRRCCESCAAGEPTVLVLEDCHWADEATLDVITLLAARIVSVPALVLASYRDDERRPRASAPLVLGELAPAPGTAEARAALAGCGRSARRAARPGRGGAARPHRRQSVLRDRGAGGGRRAASRDGARRRAGARRAPVRGRREGCSRPSRSCPGRSSCGCFEALAGELVEHLDECLASGVLSAGRLERRVPSRARPHGGRRCDPAEPKTRAASCGACGARERTRIPTSRVSRITPRRPATPMPCCGGRPHAAERAAASGAHREAAAQYARALRFADAAAARGARRAASAAAPRSAI